MNDKVFCEICKKEIKDSFTWVYCTYFNYHPLDECGGCEYPVGNTCIHKVPKEFLGGKISVEEWNKELEKFRQKKGRKNE